MRNGNHRYAFVTDLYCHSSCSGLKIPDADAQSSRPPTVGEYESCEVFLLNGICVYSTELY